MQSELESRRRVLDSVKLSWSGYKAAFLLAKIEIKNDLQFIQGTLRHQLSNYPPISCVLDWMTWILDRIIQSIQTAKNKLILQLEKRMCFTYIYIDIYLHWEKSGAKTAPPQEPFHGT